MLLYPITQGVPLLFIQTATSFPKSTASKLGIYELSPFSHHEALPCLPLSLCQTQVMVADALAVAGSERRTFVLIWVGFIHFHIIQNQLKKYENVSGQSSENSSYILYTKRWLLSKGNSESFTWYKYFYWARNKLDLETQSVKKLGFQQLHSVRKAWEG